MSTQTSNSGTNNGRRQRLFARRSAEGAETQRMYAAPSLNMSLAAVNSLVSRQMDSIDKLEARITEQGQVLTELVEVILKISDTVAKDRADVSAIRASVSSLLNVSLESKVMLAEVRASQASKEWGQDWGYTTADDLCPSDSVSDSGAVVGGDDLVDLADGGEAVELLEIVSDADKVERLVDWLANTTSDAMDVDTEV